MPLHVLNRFRQRKQAMQACLTSLLLIAFVGCTSYSRLVRIDVTSKPDANRHNPVALDLVFLYDDQVASMLSGMNGPEWFQQKETILLLNRKNMDVVHLELVPGSQSSNVLIPFGNLYARKVFLFANYVGEPGKSIADLSGFLCLVIDLQAEKYQLTDSSYCDNDPRPQQ